MIEKTDVDAIEYFKEQQADRRFAGDHTAHAAFRAAVSALSERIERDDPPQQPLTPDELRKMGGEPVYMVYAKHPRANGWMLSYYTVDYVDEVKENGATAYAHKPKEAHL